MKTIAAAAGLLFPGVALAHESGHLHPHGAEFGIGAMMLALLAGGLIGAAVAIRVRK